MCQTVSDKIVFKLSEKKKKLKMVNQNLLQKFIYFSTELIWEEIIYYYVTKFNTDLRTTSKGNID